MSFSSLMTDVGVENLALMALEMLAAELQALRQLFSMLLLFENSSNRDISLMKVIKVFSLNKVIN